MEGVIFPRVYGETLALWQPDAILLLTGTYSEKDGEPKFIVDAVQRVQGGADVDGTPPFVIHLSAPQAARLPELKALFEQHPGRSRVVLVMDEQGKERRVATQMFVDASPELTRSVATLTK